MTYLKITSKLRKKTNKYTGKQKAQAKRLLNLLEKKKDQQRNENLIFC